MRPKRLFCNFVYSILVISNLLSSPSLFVTHTLSLPLFHRRQYAKMKLIFAIHPRGGVLAKFFAKTTTTAFCSTFLLFLRDGVLWRSVEKLSQTLQTRAGTSACPLHTEWAAVKNNGRDGIYCIPRTRSKLYYYILYYRRFTRVCCIFDEYILL